MIDVWTKTRLNDIIAHESFADYGLSEQDSFDLCYALFSNPEKYWTLEQCRAYRMEHYGR